MPGGAILRSLLTAQGQVIYASAPRAPAVLDPPAGGRYLYHPGGVANPAWAEVVAPGAALTLKAQDESGGPSFLISGLSNDRFYLLLARILTTAAGSIQVRINDYSATAEHTWVRHRVYWDGATNTHDVSYGQNQTQAEVGYSPVGGATNQWTQVELFIAPQGLAGQTRGWARSVHGSDVDSTRRLSFGSYGFWFRRTLEAFSSFRILGSVALSSWGYRLYEYATA